MIMYSKNISDSLITCPICGFKKKETMPIDTCQFFYKCENCNEILRPNEKECCVYCSFGSVKCPSVQQIEKINFNKA